MENKGKGKGLGFFRRNKTPSSSSGGRATRSPSRDRYSDGPDLSGYVTPLPSAPQPKPPSPAQQVLKFVTGYRTKITAAKRVRPGIQFHFREPEPFPEHSPRDEDDDDDDDDDEDEVERDGAPDFGEDEPVELPSDGEGDDTDGMRDEEEEDEDNGPDESVPMVVEHTDRISRAPEAVPEEEPRPYQEKESGRRELYEEHLRAAREYPSEKEMMREAMRRSRQQSYAPPPLPPTVFYPSPPPHYQMYPQYPPYPPYQPYQPYPQLPIYPPSFEPPRSSFAGSSSRDFPIDMPRRSSGSYIDPDELEEIKTRADSMERERNYYRELYLAETKGNKGKNKKK